MNLCNLKAHVNRAVEQSENKHVKSIKVVSVNQLKSEDFSVKTAITKDMETLRQFADDWVHHVGNRTSVQVPTYGIITYGIRISFINTQKFEKTKNKLFMNNKPFMLNAKIKYIYIYIDTPSARRPRYIYGLILRETIELGKKP
jgi:hypothetical protein